MAGRRLWLWLRWAILWAALWVVLNVLLFVPLYAANYETATLLPSDLSATELLHRRRNLDPWRLSVEFVLLTALLALWRPAKRRWLRGIALATVTSIYFSLFYYYLYESIARDIFGLELNAYNQLALARGVAQSFGSDFLALLPANRALLWALLAGGAVAQVALIGLALTVFMRIERISLAWRGRLGVLVVIVAVVAATGWNGAKADHPRAVVSSVTAKAAQNIAASRDSARLMARFDADRLRDAYADTQLQRLTQRPNVWLIFVESYGSVLLEREDWRRDYEALLAEMENALARDGWHAASTLSEAPTWGGGSWLSYTSFVAGLRVDSQPYYLSLLNRYQARPLPGLFSLLREQGYRHVQLSTPAKPLGEGAWHKYTNFYGVDEWLRFDELNYGGALHGWGPAPPDQYGLWFAEDYLRSSTPAASSRSEPGQSDEQPLIFFFITQNSHYPWKSPPPALADDWRSLSDGVSHTSQQVEQTTTRRNDWGDIDHAARRANYWLAIEYELNLLTRFIRERGGANDLFVLVGDHQPPRISRRDDTLRVPLHVLSREPTLTEQFEAHGFADGLFPATEPTAPPVRHEGFASLLLRALLAQSGVPIDALPPYHPDGIEPW